MTSHIAEKHNVPKPVVKFSGKVCNEDFPRFYSLSQHENTEHDFPIKTAKVDPNDTFHEVDDMKPKEGLRSCQHFLVDCELERARHKVFNYAIDKLNAKIVDEKVDQISDNLKCAVKVNLVFVFISKTIENGAIRNSYAHKSNTLPD